jgi:hypothetical protein
MIARMIRQKLQSVEFKSGVPSRNFDPGADPLLPTPITLLGFMAGTRIVVSLISKYAAIDGAPTDWHAFHLRQIRAGQRRDCIRRGNDGLEVMAERISCGGPERF